MQTILTRGRVYNYSHCVGNNATSGTGFHYPNGIARGEGDLVYVCNQPDELQPVPHISKVSVGKTWHEEEHIQDIGGLGTEDGNFIWPSSITLDDKGCLYVTDEWLNRISVFDCEGKFLYKWGVSGSQEGELLGPTGIAINSEGHVFVTENLNHRVSVFDKQGSFLNTWGSLGTEHGKFNHPWGITIDNNDQVYIADWRNDRVEQYSSEGDYLLTFGNMAETLSRPSSVAVDLDGDVYIADWGNNKIEIFDPNGDPITRFLGNAERLSKWGEARVVSNPDAVKARMRVPNLEQEWRFYRPTGVATGSDGRIMVTESQRMRIQIYQKESDWELPQFNL